ncbi:hypothetical protein BDN71DRAFT_1508049, partial [Pleurotus eryngii]
GVEYGALVKALNGCDNAGTVDGGVETGHGWKAGGCEGEVAAARATEELGGDPGGGKGSKEASKAERDAGGIKEGVELSGAKEGDQAEGLGVDPGGGEAGDEACFEDNSEADDGGGGVLKDERAGVHMGKDVCGGGLEEEKSSAVEQGGVEQAGWMYALFEASKRRCGETGAGR